MGRFQRYSLEDFGKWTLTFNYESRVDYIYKYIHTHLFSWQRHFLYGVKINFIFFKHSDSFDQRGTILYFAINGRSCMWGHLNHIFEFSSDAFQTLIVGYPKPSRLLHNFFPQMAKWCQWCETWCGLPGRPEERDQAVPAVWALEGITKILSSYFLIALCAIICLIQISSLFGGTTNHANRQLNTYLNT